MMPNNDASRTDATDADLPSINGAASSGGTVDLTNNIESATLYLRYHLFGMMSIVSCA